MRTHLSSAVALLLCTLSLNSPVAAEPMIGGPPQGKVIEYGIINSLGTTQTTQAPDTLDGTRTKASELKFSQHTARIPCKAGISFGFRFLLTGISEKQSVSLEKFVKHPRMKNSEGREEDHYTITETSPVANGTVVGGAGYRLNRPEELKPGAWVFEIRYHGKTLVSQSFTVYAAK
jgi:Domain of unknown function (DUF3859)